MDASHLDAKDRRGEVDTHGPKTSNIRLTQTTGASLPMLPLSFQFVEIKTGR